MRKREFFIERRLRGDYAVRDGGAIRRARAVCHTQAEAIAKARQIDPDAAILVERVRHTDKEHPDKWRKP